MLATGCQCPVSVSGSTTLVQTDLLDGLQRNFVQTFMVPKKEILMTLEIRWLFKHHQQVKVFTLTCLKVFQVSWNILTSPGWSGTKMLTDIDGSQTLNSNNFRNPQLFPLWHYEVHMCGLKWNVSTAIWIFIKSEPDIFVPFRMNCNKSGGFS